LNGKIHQYGVFEQKIWNSESEISLGDSIERRLDIVKKSKTVNSLPPNVSPVFIIQAIVETYESFADFVSDVKA